MEDININSVNIKKNYNFFFIILITVIIITGVFVRTKMLFVNDSFWFDTCALGANITRNFTDFFKPLDYLQAAPPFFMIISKFLCSVFYNGSNLEQKDFILRLVPYFSGILSMPLFSFLVQKMFKNYFITTVCTAFFSYNNYLIYYSREFKPYSSDVLISLVILLIFWTIKLKNCSTVKLFLYSLIFTLAPWFSYASIFILLSGFLIITFEGIKEKALNFKTFSLLYLPVIISILIFYNFYY